MFLFCPAVNEWPSTYLFKCSLAREENECKEHTLDPEGGSLSNDDELEIANGTDCDEQPESEVQQEAKPTKSKQKKNKGKKKALSSTTIPVIKSSDDEEHDSATEAGDMIGLRLGRATTAAPSDDDDDWTGGSKKSNRKAKTKGKAADSGPKGKAAKAQAKGEAEPSSLPAATGSSKESGPVSDDESTSNRPVSQNIKTKQCGTYLLVMCTKLIL